MNLKVSDAKREDGFTLIELLVVVIIIGILAAIAIPTFLNQRERAWDAAAQSDLRNAAVAQESQYTETQTYVDTVAALQTEGFNPSADVTLTIPTATATAYCMQAIHANSGNTFHFDSADGDPQAGTCV